MRLVQDDGRRRLVDLARLDADEAVLDVVDPADAVRAGDPVQLLDQLRAVELLAVQGDGPTVVEGDLNTWANREPVLERLARSFTPCTDRRPTFGGGLRLDWFFARLPPGWTLTCRRLEEKYGSDHYPILGVLEH